jgi:hypothetical protein
MAAVGSDGVVYAYALVASKLLLLLQRHSGTGAVRLVSVIHFFLDIQHAVCGLCCHCQDN